MKNRPVPSDRKTNKRARSRSEECVRPDRLEELLAFVDHLSQTVVITCGSDADAERKPTQVTYMRLEGADDTIEVFEARKFRTDNIRRSVRRYLCEIHEVTLIIPVKMSHYDACTVTMEDGTVVLGGTVESLTTVSCMRRKPALHPLDLIHAIRGGEFQEVVDAVMDGVDVNSRAGEEIDTPLMTAATMNDLDILRYLLDVPGIDAEETDNNGDPILHGAIFGMSRETLTEFVHRGAGMYAQDRQGRSLLHEVMGVVHIRDFHIEVILQYAPILTLHTDRNGHLPTDSLEMADVEALDRALKLIRPVAKSVFDRVTEMIDCVISVREVGRLILSYYTVSSAFCPDARADKPVSRVGLLLNSD
jgi:hypothetical protein